MKARLCYCRHMTRHAGLLWGLLLSACLVLAGCLPSTRSRLDEEREPHYLAGKNRVRAMDYSGAIECFEKALQANPQSAAAHFELACLFEQRQADPAAAIYHYEHYLKLRPEEDARHADLARQHILSCKQELARTVSLGPVTDKFQRQLDQLAEENKRLAEENKRLQEDLNRWTAYAARLQTLTNAGPTASPVWPSRPAGSSSPAAPGVAANAATPRTHTVKAGESLSVVARKYGIKLESLIAVNPGLEPRRLQVGQVLTIPSP